MTDKQIVMLMNELDDAYSKKSCQEIAELTIKIISKITNKEFTIKDLALAISRVYVRT
jgi:flagellar motor switch protein FliG